MIEPATEARAVIFDVQSFSIHDGPGIRTTVFFKGCPLRCAWCHNPESQSAEPELMYHRNLCTGCMLCVGVCAYGVHTVLPDGSRAVNHRLCRGCGKCTEVCCYDALSLLGKSFTAGELLEKIKGDIRYYTLGEEKGGERGGITFSGGEPLLYAEFIRNFCALVPGIHTALETSGYAQREDFERLLDRIDLFLFDVKLADGARHSKWCGEDNARILENLDFLYSAKKKITLRLPVIQGVNDDAGHFDFIAELLRKYPEIERAELLPYDSYGIGKAEALGKPVSGKLPPTGASGEMAEKWLSALRSRACTRVYRS
ncbi:MAG: glycyl-radical enzyme activating protein [Treponema sp.]|jgi:pyruvate formate lyase activating enzyme|nr:glycyl-radical enzyme activating protein [Treponema sp.]